MSRLNEIFLTLDVSTCSMLQTLLYDVNSTVRAVVVRGVCLIVTQFWEFLPTATISWFLNRLVSDLAWDAASPEVRASVIEVSRSHRTSPSTRPGCPPRLRVLTKVLKGPKRSQIDFFIFKALKSLKFGYFFD